MRRREVEAEVDERKEGGRRRREREEGRMMKEG